MTTVESPPASTTTGDNRVGAMLLHLATVPLGVVVAFPAFLLTRNRSRWMHQQARAALNWQLAIILLKAGNIALSMVFAPMMNNPNIWHAPAIPEPIVKVIDIGLIIYDAWRAYRGHWEPYPKIFRLVKSLPRPTTA